MITSEIFLENKRLDISDGISSLITYTLDDVKDFAGRNTAFSKTIVLPGTANNNLLFGNIFNVSISNPYNSAEDNVGTNFNASVHADCLMFQNHIQIFKGTMRLMEVIIVNGVPEYEVSVFGELGGLISILGARKLEDLDFSAYDHTYNYTNITASWDASGGTGYYYPLIDYGEVSAAKLDYDITAFRPAFFVKEYLDKILTQGGYRYECDLFSTERFRRLIVPHNQKQLVSMSNSMLDVSKNVTDTYTTDTNIDFEVLSLGSFTASLGDTRFTWAGAAPSVSGDIRLQIVGQYYSDLRDVLVEIRVNGVSVANVVLPYTGDTVLTDYSVDISKLGYSFAVSDYVEARVSVSGFSTWAFDTSSSCQLTFLSAQSTLVPLSSGDPLIANDTIPKNIKQIDFFSSIIRLFNLYVFESKDANKKLYIEPYVDFFDLNVSGVTDWTYKVDRSKTIRLKPMSELNARFYDFKFKDDSDYYNDLYKKRYGESYGSRFYDSAFEFANDRSAVELIFSPTVLVGYTGIEKIVSVMYKLNSGVEEKMDTNIRILQTKKITGVGSWAIKNGVATLVSGLTAYGYAGHYDDPDAPANDIHFGVPAELFLVLVSGSINNTQFNIYWSSYMAEITDKDSKLMTCYMKLTAKDIFDLNFSKLIYCDGVYWRLNKIEDWNASSPDVCKVELLKVINLLY